MVNQAHKIMTDALDINPEQSRLLALSRVLEEYARAMAPGMPIDTEEGAAYQKRLYRTILGVLKQEGPEFVSQYSMLLNFVHANSDTTGAFYRHYPNRFQEMVQLDKTERLVFQRLIRLITLTANPATRLLNLKQISLPVLTAGLRSDQADRVIAFYTI